MQHPIPRSPLLKSTLDSLAVDVHEDLRAPQHIRLGTAELIQEVVKGKQLFLVDMRSQPMLGKHPPGLKRTVRGIHHSPPRQRGGVRRAARKARRKMPRPLPRALMRSGRNVAPPTELAEKVRVSPVRQVKMMSPRHVVDKLSNFFF